MNVGANERTTQDYMVTNPVRRSTIATRVYIANSSPARRKGLLGVESLKEGFGLWIAPCEAIHTFGMKMPIDVMFLDRHRRIRKLVASMRPSRISICLRAHSVLELPAGTIVRAATRVGDQLTFQAAPQA